jgi:hypothetical protein
MIFQTNGSLENKFLSLPETGMGYQIVDAIRGGNLSSEKFLVLNSEIVIELNKDTGNYVKKVINEGIESVKSKATLITLYFPTVLNEDQFRMVVNEPKNKNERGAIDNPVEFTDGNEVFVRLSAFENDRRIDKIKKRLLHGSFTTTLVDYNECKATDDDPVERYALPNEDKIKFAFYIMPLKIDPLQRGIVQPANGKRGGGDEAYFKNGTSNGTYLNQAPY